MSKPAAKQMQVRVLAAMEDAIDAVRAMMPGTLSPNMGRKLCGKIREVAEAALSAPVWSTTPPTAPGWYWARYAGTENVALMKWSSRAWYDPHVGMLTPASSPDLWLGPIEPPALA